MTQTQAPPAESEQNPGSTSPEVVSEEANPLFDLLREEYDYQFEVDRVTHKDSGEEVINIDDLTAACQQLGLEPVDFSQGGVIFDEAGRPRYGVKPREYRKNERPEVTEGDINQVTYRSTGYRSNSELEPVLTQAGELIDKTHSQELRQRLEERGVTVDYELLEACLELSFKPATENLLDNAQRTLGKLRIVIEEALNEDPATGARWQPFSSVIHRQIDFPDFPDHDYVTTIVNKDFGSENIRRFDVLGWQNHAPVIVDPETGELDYDTAVKAAKVYQPIMAPLLYGASLSAPFTAGELRPNLRQLHTENDAVGHEKLKEDKRKLDFDEWLSTRYAARLRSPSGGSIREEFPESFKELMQRANQKMQNQEIPTFSRVMGQHTDLRLRPEYGTIETCQYDVAGGNVKKLMAFQAVDKAIFTTLQSYIQAGRLTELQEKFPGIVPRRVNQTMLESTHNLSIDISRVGSEVKVSGADGRLYNYQEIFEQVLELADTSTLGRHPDTKVPETLTEELRRSVMIPDEEIFEHYRDEDGILDLRGFYETGIGTFAHWVKALRDDLESTARAEGRNTTDAEIIGEIMERAPVAVERHLQNPDLNVELQVIMEGLQAWLKQNK